MCLKSQSVRFSVKGDSTAPHCLTLVSCSKVRFCNFRPAEVLESSHVLEVHLYSASASCTCQAVDLAARLYSTRNHQEVDRRVLHTVLCNALESEVLLPSHLHLRGSYATLHPSRAVPFVETREAPSKTLGLSSLRYQPIATLRTQQNAVNKESSCANHKKSRSHW